MSRRALEYADAAAGIIRRDWLTFSSYRTQLLTQLGSLFLSLCLFHFLSQLVRVSAFPSPKAYFAYVVVGIMIVQTLQSSLLVSSSIRAELVAGTFERLLLSPFGGVAGMVSMMFFPFLEATFSSTLTLTIAALVFGVHISWATLPLALPIAVLGSATFAAFGMLFASSTVIFKRAVGGTGLIISGIGIISGLYFPVTLLPHSIEWLSHVQPFTPSVDLLRHVIVDTPLAHPWRAVLKVVLFVAAMVPISIYVLGAALRTAQRRGTVVEY